MKHANAHIELTNRGRAFAKEHGLMEPPNSALALGQSWLAAPVAGFCPAVALMYPREDGLHIVVSLADNDIFNTADGPNQETWKTGDVVEFFIGKSGDDAYFELHVTPENHRLQLKWSSEAFISFRTKKSSLEDHTIADQSFCFSSVSITLEDNLWQVYFFIPWASLGFPKDQDQYQLDFAICRYDVTRATRNVVNSSTAALTTLDFHRRPEWNRITFSPRTRD